MIFEAGVIFSFGVFLLLHFFYLMITSTKTKKWIPVKGKILISNMDCIAYIGEDADVSYKAKIEYQYDVNGKSYLSKKVFYGDYVGANMPYRAKKVIKKYGKDGIVTVYYNPDNPKKSVLETGINLVIYKILFTSLCLILLSIVIMMNESFFISLIKQFRSSHANLSLGLPAAAGVVGNLKISPNNNNANVTIDKMTKKTDKGKILTSGQQKMLESATKEKTTNIITEIIVNTTVETTTNTIKKTIQEDEKKN